jgi:Uma2 family endonuclease
MSTIIAEPSQDVYDISDVVAKVRAIAANLVTENDEPVDNFYSGIQQRLLVEPLYISWTPPRETDAAPRPFLAQSNVGLFYALHANPIVPDMFLSLDVEVGPDWATTHEPRSYFFWELGKAPELALEIVSNKVGHELDGKLRDYARAGVLYYVVYDPWQNLGETPVLVHELVTGRYELRPDLLLPNLNLSLTLWHGEYEGTRAEWLRWCDAQGNLLLTGKERADQEAARADQEAARAARLAAKLRELGVEPE